MESTQTYRARRAALRAHAADTHIIATGANLTYLTGVDEDGARWVSGPTGEALFITERDTTRAHWDGELPSVETLGAMSGVQDIREGASVDAVTSTLQGARAIAWSRGEDLLFDTHLIGWMRAAPRARYASTIELDVLTWSARSQKDPSELEALRRAANASALAHWGVMRGMQVGMSGGDAAAMFQRVLAMCDVLEQPYSGIFAVGDEACCLHPRPTLRRLGEAELLLVDAAGRDHTSGQVSDISRTSCALRYTAHQRALYDVVLAAQLAAIGAVTPGAALTDVEDAAIRELDRGLDALGIHVDVRSVFTHGIGHLVGLEIHDPWPVAKTARTLHQDMTLTIEPGLYIDATRDDVPPEYRGIGIRIEDVVIVGREHAEVLTSLVTKDAGEIEALRDRAHAAPMSWLEDTRALGLQRGILDQERA